MAAVTALDFAAQRAEELRREAAAARRRRLARTRAGAPDQDRPEPVEQAA